MMHATNYNRCEWDVWVVDHSYADDGFGNLHLTDIDVFWYNAEAARMDQYSPLH